MKVLDLIRQTSSKAVKWEPGIYTTRINACKEITTKAGKVLKVIETEILESNGAVPEGVTTNTFIDENGPFDYGKRELNNFLVAAAKALTRDNPDLDLDVDVTEFKELIFGEENILAGSTLKVEAYNKKKKDGTISSFTNVNWL